MTNQELKMLLKLGLQRGLEDSLFPLSCHWDGVNQEREP